MGKATGFMEYARELPTRRPVNERINDWFEIYRDFPEEKPREQGARCMDCGVPFCHTGCPVNNLIPDWNDLVYRGRWREARPPVALHQQFPRIHRPHLPRALRSRLRARHQPAAGHHQANREEHRRARLGTKAGSARSRRSTHTGKRVAVVGSGPAGLAAAQQLRRAGHSVTVFEKTDRIGGLLRYGIPNFKLEKHVVDRRLEQMSAEGVTLPDQRPRRRQRPGRTTCAATSTPSCSAAAPNSRATCTSPAANSRASTSPWSFCRSRIAAAKATRCRRANDILATGKRVVIIGGGDTGADCLGTEPSPEADLRPPVRNHAHAAGRARAANALAAVALQLRTEGAHEEGGIRDWSINTTKFTGDEHGNVKQLHGVRVGPPPKFEPIAGTEFTLDVDLVLLAMGFLGPVRNGMIEQLGVDSRPARQRRHRRRLHVLGSRRLRRRRHAPRPVAGRLGHRRRPQSRRRRGHLPAPARAMILSSRRDARRVSFDGTAWP